MWALSVTHARQFKRNRVTTRTSRNGCQTALYGAGYAIRLGSPPEGIHPAHGKVCRAYWSRLTATARVSVTPSSDYMSKS